jgi:hypothetical protein
LLDCVRPNLDNELHKKLIKELIGKCVKMGLCGVHSLESRKSAELVASICEEQHFYFTWYYQDLKTKYDEIVDYKSLFLPESPHFRNGGIKLFSDGSLNSDTAWLFDIIGDVEPKTSKYLNHEQIDRLEREICEAMSQNVPMAIHTIGDYAVNQIAKMLIKYNKCSTNNSIKHRLEHLQAVRPQDHSLLKEANIHASMQPVHMKSDVELIKQKWHQAKDYSFPLNSVSKYAELALGSDSPVETLNPFEGIKYATNRNGFLDAEAITLEEALKSYTYKHHLISNREITYGMIKENQIANLIIIKKETFDDNESYINETELTMIDGKIIHRK